MKAKGGRPRKTAPPRHPGGKLRQRTDAELLLSATETAQAQRLRVVKPGDVFDPRASTSLGRACLNDMIPRPEYRAGVEYLAIDSLWRMAQGLLPYWPRCVAFEEPACGGKQGKDWDDEDVLRISARRLAVRAVLDAGLPNVRLVTNEVVLQDRPVTDSNIIELRLGLEALRRHFFDNRAGQAKKQDTVLSWMADGARPKIDASIFTKEGTEK